MKRLAKNSFYYSIAGLFLGIFYREFTKINDFTGKTMLAGLHTHAFVLGTFFILIVLLLEKQYKLTEHNKFKPFFIVYNIGLISMLFTMTLRGVLEVLEVFLSGNLDTLILWIAGFTHIAMAAGFVRFFLLLFKRMDAVETQNS